MNDPYMVMKICFSVFALLCITFLTTRCIYVRIPAFKIKLENRTSIPDSSIRITNKVVIQGEKYFKNTWNNSRRVADVNSEEKNIPFGSNIETIKLSSYSFLKRKEAIAELRFFDHTNHQLLTTIQYSDGGHYNDLYSSVINTQANLKNPLALKEFTCKIILPGFFLKLLEDYPSEINWLKHKSILFDIRAYAGSIRYPLLVDNKTNDTIKSFLLIPLSEVNQSPQISFSATGAGNQPFIDLLFNQETNSIVWSEQGIKQLQEIVAKWLAEEQKFDMLVKLLGDANLNKTMATQLLITASNPPYEITGQPGFAANNHAIVKLLLSKGADPNATNLDGEAIIISLALRNSTLSVQELANAGADIQVKSSGKTLVEWVQQRENKELIRFFKDFNQK